MGQNGASGVTSLLTGFFLNNIQYANRVNWGVLGLSLSPYSDTDMSLPDSGSARRITAAES